MTVYAAVTDDDPAGTPVWSPWTPFMVADFNCRGAKFKISLNSDDATNNIDVSELTIHVKEAV